MNILVHIASGIRDPSTIWEILYEALAEYNIFKILYEASAEYNISKIARHTSLEVTANNIVRGFSNLYSVLQPTGVFQDLGRNPWS